MLSTDIEYSLCILANTVCGMGRRRINSAIFQYPSRYLREQDDLWRIQVQKCRFLDPDIYHVPRKYYLGANRASSGEQESCSEGERTPASPSVDFVTPQKPPNHLLADDATVRKSYAKLLYELENYQHSNLTPTLTPTYTPPPSQLPQVDTPLASQPTPIALSPHFTPAHDEEKAVIGDGSDPANKDGAFVRGEVIHFDLEDGENRHSPLPAEEAARAAAASTAEQEDVSTKANTPFPSPTVANSPLPPMPFRPMSLRRDNSISAPPAGVVASPVPTACQASLGCTCSTCTSINYQSRMQITDRDGYGGIHSSIEGSTVANIEPGRYAEAYKRSSRVLSWLASTTVPREMVFYLTLASKWILRDAIDASGSRSIIGADVMIPLFTLALIYSQIPHMHLLLYVLMHFGEYEEQGDVSYNIASLEGSVMCIMGFAIPPEAEQHHLEFMQLKGYNTRQSFLAGSSNAGNSSADEWRIGSPPSGLASNGQVASSVGHSAGLGAVRSPVQKTSLFGSPTPDALQEDVLAMEELGNCLLHFLPLSFLANASTSHNRSHPFPIIVIVLLSCLQ